MNKPISISTALSNSYGLIRQNQNFGYLVKLIMALYLPIALLILPLAFMGPLLSGAASVSPKSEYKYDFEGKIESNVKGLMALRADDTAPVETLVPTTEEPALTSSYEDGARTSLDETIAVVTVIIAVIMIIIFSILFLIYSAFIYAVFINAVIDVREGKIRGLRQGLRKGTKNLGALIVLFLLSNILIVFGLLFFIIPGLYFMVVFTFAPLVLVSEDLSAIESISRTRELIKGNILNLLGKGIIVTFVLIVISFVLSLLAESLAWLGIEVFTLMVAYEIYLSLKKNQVKA